MLEVGWWRGVGVGGSLRNLFKNILKQGWVKAIIVLNMFAIIVVRRGRGSLKVSTPLPPSKKISILHFNIHFFDPVWTGLFEGLGYFKSDDNETW